MSSTVEVLCIGIDPSGLGVGDRPRLDGARIEFTVSMDRQGVLNALNHPQRWDLVLCRSSAFYDLAVDHFLVKAEGALAASLILICPPASTLSPAEAARRGAADSVMNGDKEHLEMVMKRELATTAMRKRLRALLSATDAAGSGAMTLAKINDFRPRSSASHPPPEHADADDLSPVHDMRMARQTTPPADSTDELDDRHIKRLIDAGGLTLQYQPILTLHHDGGPQEAMFEVLLRLRDEQGLLLPPSQFFPAAARHNWLGRLDLWVFRRALPILSRIQASTTAAKTTHLFVNLCTETIAFALAIDAIIETIDNSNLQDGSITIEIKRELLIDQPAALDRVKAVLQQHGHGLLLEQVGLSDTALLEEHGQALTHIKLDPALIQALAAGAVSEADVRDLISIARDHGIKVIALAVESADILPHLYAVGVNAIQGHFISMPYEELVYPDVFSISLQ